MFALWQQLLDAITRPPRDAYSEDTLVGGSRGSFRLALPGYPVGKFYRESVILTNPRGQKLICSHYRCCREGMSRPGTAERGDDGGNGVTDNEASTAPSSSPVVIYLHSNSGSQRDAEEILFTVLQYNMSVFALDFAGSGLSEGEYVTLGAYEQHDVQTAVDYLRSLPSVSTIGLWGRSMGAVTALLYSHRDPSIAACVVDSPFSSLVDLMTEIATDSENGMGLPKSVVKMLLVFMKRSVRKRAAFKLEDVSPKDVARDTYVPVLFGHGREDTFIRDWHSERLFERHGAEVKRVVMFEGDHNSVRPPYWYEVGMDFLISALFVEGQGVEVLGRVDQETHVDLGVPTEAVGGGGGDVDHGLARGHADHDSKEGAAVRDAEAVSGDEDQDSRTSDIDRNDTADRPGTGNADRSGSALTTPAVATIGIDNEGNDEHVMSLTPDDIVRRLEEHAAHRMASPLPLRSKPC